MRSRLAVTAAAALLLASCTRGSGGKQTPASLSGTPLTPVVVDCPRFADTSKLITQAQTKLYSGSAEDAHQAVETLATNLTALRQGAPTDVQRALSDLIDGFRNTEQLLANPTTESRKKAAALSPRLSSDGQKITGYVISRCGRS